MRALTVVESQVYTDHNVDMHQSDSCMFDSAAQNLVSISGCKTFSYLCHSLVPRPRPAFRRLKYGKAVEGLEYFIT